MSGLSPQSPRVFRKPPQNHHTLGVFAEVSNKRLWEGLVQRAEYKHPTGIQRETQRSPGDTRLGQCGLCEYGDKALDELQLPSSNKEKEPEFGERFR